MRVRFNMTQVERHIAYGSFTVDIPELDDAVPESRETLAREWYMDNYDPGIHDIDWHDTEYSDSEAQEMDDVEILEFE